MPSFMKVDSTRPLALIGSERAAVVTNGATSGTLYVGGPSVSSASNDFSIAAGASRPVKGPAWVIASASIPISTNNITIERARPNAVTRWWVGNTPFDDGSGGGASATPTAGTAFLGQVDILERCTLTGIRYLAGGTGGTDDVLVALYDYKGNPLAWSAIAGAVCGTANEYTSLAFTAPYEVVVPGRYFAGITAAGTTCRIQVQNGTTGLAGDVGVLGGTHASAWTDGSAPVAVTVPTTVGEIPVLSTY